MSDDIRDRRFKIVTVSLLGTIAVLAAWDLILDYDDDPSWGHIGIEILVFIIAIAGISYLWHQMAQTRIDLSQARMAAKQWRDESRELLQGLGIAIDQQFTRWHLTNAEAEVALLLLKGLSHKEIAGVRTTSERTIREQARAVYRKSGLAGRNALSAFFLEDLLLPPNV